MDHGFSILRELAILSAAALVVSLLLGRLRLPSVVAFLVTGVLIGPGGLGLVGAPETVRTLAEIGIVMLLFAVGLEFSIVDLRRLGRSAAVAGFGQIVLTAGLGALVLWLAGILPARAVFFGLLIATSSTALVLRMITERGELQAPHGKLITAVLLLQDLALVPMVLLVPLERALPLSLLAVAVWLLLTLPLSLYSLRGWRARAGWLAGMVVVPVLFWELRAHFPPAGLAVTDARVTQTIENLTPGEPKHRIRRAELDQGVIAYAAIRAPAGLAQNVIFEWRHNGERERIEVQIQGGRADGFRAYSLKRVFPEDATGRWIVDVLTPQEQLLERLEVVCGREAIDERHLAEQHGEIGGKSGHD